MIHFKYDYERCRRSRGKDCRNCIQNCVMRILAIRDNHVVMSDPDQCIFCLNCQGGCMIDVNVIKIWDDEEPDLTPIAVTTERNLNVVRD